MVDNPHGETSPCDSILAVILAGGAATRMGGGDKCLIEIGGAPILRHILARVRPQVAATALSANGNAARFAAYGLDVIPDNEVLQGPLAGVIAALGEAERRGLPFCLTVPGDAPFPPRDLAARLLGALEGEALCAVPDSDGHRQSVFALWRTSSLANVRNVYAGGTRSLWRVQEALGAVGVPFADEDAFAGLNEPGDREKLEALMAEKA